MSIASWTSPAASGSTLPISRAISWATSSLCSASSEPKRKRISPRLGAGTSRHSSYAAFAAATARSTSSALDFGKTPSTSPVAGLVVSKVSPEAASTHSPPMKFLKVLVAVLATAGTLLRRVGLGERARRASAPAIPDLALAAKDAALPPVLALAAVDDHRHVRVVLVVLDHLLVELVLELARNHAVDHPVSDCRDGLGWRQRRLDGRDVRGDAAVLGELRVPAREHRLQLVRVVAALGQAHRLGRVRSDAVLVPGDVPGDAEHDLAVRPGEGHDRGLRDPEAL